MATYGLRLQNGDLAWSGGVLLQLTDPLDAVRQLLETRLKMAAGEWFLDPEEGTPYYEEILGKGHSEAQIRQALHKRILATPGIVDVVSLSVSVDAATRRGSVTYQARANEGLISGTTEVG